MIILRDDRPQSESQAEFLIALGATIEDWQLVEMTLCRLFTTAMQPPDDRVGEEVFYVVTNFRDKLSMVDAALRFTLWRNKILLPKWVKLESAIQRRTKRRNKIVHAHTWSEHVGDGETDRKLGPPRRLSTVIQAESNPQKGFFTVRQIKDAGRSFRLLARCIQEFDEQVREFQAQPLEWIAQQSDQNR